jgi:hypothetical protein
VSALSLVSAAITGPGGGAAFTAEGDVDLLANGAADGRITAFAAGDPAVQSNDGANRVRLPFYPTLVSASGDFSALCRTGDLLVSGGFNPSDSQSGWHCRFIHTMTGAECATSATYAICLEGF